LLILSFPHCSWALLLPHNLLLLLPA
jgi:hypothetical protein